MLDLTLFNAIGFNVSTFEELRPYLDMAIAGGAKPVSARGVYSYWSLGNGAEVWVALNKERSVVNFDPHFVGGNSVPVRLDSMYDFPDELAGGIKVWTNPSATEKSIQFPLVVNIPEWDFVYSILKKHGAQTQGQSAFDLQIAAFPEELSCFGSEEDYYAAQKSPNAFASQHFIPTGLFVEDGEMPSPRAAFAGTIVDGHVLVNPVTQLKTWHLAVQTLGMTIDVVAHASSIIGRPQKGGILSGQFWLSGRPTFAIKNLQVWLNNRPSS